MGEFAYRVLDRCGEVRTGVLDAQDIPSASASLHRKGFTVLDVSLSGPTLAMRLNEPIVFFDRPSERDIQSFLRDMGRLLSSGLAVDDALQLQAHTQTRALLCRAIEKMREAIREGQTLASALALYKQYFNTQIIAAVEAGENSGTLAEALAALSSSMDQSLSFRERVRSALIYPGILMVMVVATFVMVMTFMLPQFAPLFAGHEEKLPWATRFVMGLGDFFNGYWYGFVLILFLAVLLAVHVGRSAQHRARFLEGLCALPGFEAWVLTPDIIRSMRTLGICLRSGISVDRALAMSLEAVRLPHVAEDLATARSDIRKGKFLSQAFSHTPWLPALVLQFIRVGEQTGRVGVLLDEAAALVAQDYEQRLEKGLAFLSPLLTLFMGGIVALLVGSVLLGIMSINDVAL